jgi:hypothetical protein
MVAGHPKHDHPPGYQPYDTDDDEDYFYHAATGFSAPKVKARRDRMAAKKKG